MASQGEQISTEREKEEEDFYDCQDTLEPPDQRGGVGDEEGKCLEDSNIKTDRLADTRESLQEQEEQQGDRLQLELQEEKLGDGSQDNSDSELKENSEEVEFDDEYLREVEKELTEEEKEVRSSHLFICSTGKLEKPEWHTDKLKLCSDKIMSCSQTPSIFTIFCFRVDDNKV